MPTMPTNAQWVDAWQALSISGITVKATPPLSLSTSDLPCAWPELPEVTLDQTIVSCVDSNKRRTMVFHVAIEAIGQNTQKGNYENVIPHMDRIEAAVDGMRNTLVNWIDYTISMVADIVIADVVYWGLRVVATGRNTP